MRQIDMLRHDQYVQTVIDLSNRSLTDNWGYTPVTEAEALAVARDLKPVIQPKGVPVAEDAQGRPISFNIALPDVDMLQNDLNGYLFPFGWSKLLLGLKRLHNYRLFALAVIPEYHG